MNVSTVDELGLIFIHALTDVIATISGFSLQAQPIAPDIGFKEMTGVMSLQGTKHGVLFISASEADMRVLCSYMIGVADGDITTDDINDALCEIVNMTAGNTKLRLGGSDYIFSLTSPFLIRGENMSITTKNRVRVISSILSDGNVTLKLKVVY